MEYGLIALLAIAGLIILYLLARLWSLRRAARELCAQFEEKLAADTNTPILLSSSDRAMRALAACINRQLRLLRREKQRMENGDREQTAAMTNISHNLRTPLTAICGYLDLLEQEPLGENAARYLAVLRERTDAMRTMTEELLQYTVLRSTADELTRERVDIGAVLEQSLAGFYAVFTARGIAPNVSLPEKPVTRALDAAALRRVLDNILSNAAKYADGALNITLSPDGTLCFSNPAARLDRVQAAQLFDRFYTVNSASGSAGLGLSIAKLLTEKMGGAIAAEYDGGTLYIRLCFDGEN